MAFGVLAVFALAGWATTVICMSRSVLLQANAQKVMQQIVDREDAKVFSLAQRAQKIENRGKPPEPGRPTTEEVSAEHPLASLFRSPGGSTPVAEQPDPDELEIREA